MSRIRSPELAPPPFTNESALPPPPPANKPDSPPPLNAFAKLIQAYVHTNDASTLITKGAIDGSIKLNKDSVYHLESCQAPISTTKEALQVATSHLLQATLVKQGQSLSHIIPLEDD
ncbi:unnamed protein product [Eruca vesicaria subsp. sativa]|uniref:Uncharacterized protein n=1 Tax=Eruca vesicaria subsp. sativa TaxID=29727 RepID=A0ABC8JYD4_ERUVS|nr:unnamed protein product [Eruca vesicaria subsp. sativa]